MVRGIIGAIFGLLYLGLILPAQAATVSAGGHLDYSLNLSGLQTYDYFRYVRADFNSGDLLDNEAFNISVGSTLGGSDILNWSSSSSSPVNFALLTTSPTNIDGLATLFVRFSIFNGSVDLNLLSLGLRETASSPNVRFYASPISVPLPAGLPLLLAGLGALGMFARRRTA